VNGTSTTRVKVDIGGNGVVPRVGLHALGSFADRLGGPLLGDAAAAHAICTTATRSLSKRLSCSRVAGRALPTSGTCEPEAYQDFLSNFSRAERATRIELAFSAREADEHTVATGASYKLPSKAVYSVRLCLLSTSELQPIVAR
jgi:hypothetical protein